MPDIKKLTDKNGNEFYPRSVMDAIYDSNTGRALSNGVPASRYRTFTINNPVADTSIDGFEYSQTFDWDNVLATDEASADIVSGYSSDYSVGVETLQDSIKLYFDEDPTGAVVRVILYPASIGNLSENVAAALDNRVTDLEERCEYSTTEKVVGKWIDNKPIYQKTVQITVPTTSANGTMVANRTDIGVSNIETVINLSGFVVQNSTTFITLPFFASNGGYQLKAIIMFADNNFVIACTNGFLDYSGLTGYITIRYTKTTD